MKMVFKYLIYISIAIFIFYLGSCTPNSSITGVDDSIDETLLGLKIWSLTKDTFAVVDSNSYIEIISEVNYNNSPVKDSTRVTFFSNMGEIEQEKFTVDGQAITKLYPKDSGNNLLSGDLKVVASVGEKVFTYDTLDIYLKLESGISLNKLLPSNGGDLIVSEGDSILFSASATTANGISPSYVWKLDGNVVSTVENFNFKTDFRNYSSGNYDLTLEISASDYIPLVYSWNVKVLDVVQGIVVNSYSPSNNDIITIDEGEALNFMVDAVDLDGNTLSYCWKLNNEIVSTTDSYNFVTNYSSEGSYSMILELSSSKSTQLINWNIIVNNKNQEIIVIEILPNDGGNVYIDEGENCQFSINATDPDGDPLAYEWSVDGLNVSTANNYNFETAFLPENGYSAGVYQLNLKATDISGDENSVTNFLWYINVKNVDRDIVVNQLLPGESGTVYEIFEGDSLKFLADAFDPDGNNLGYKWKLDGSEISIEDNFYYKPDYTSAGGHIVTLELTDEERFESLRLDRDRVKSKNNIFFYWNVNVMEKNAPIEVNYISPTPGDLVINEGESINFLIDAYDPEGNELSYKWKINGGEIVSLSSSYQFITDFNSSGSYAISLNVSDGDGSELFYLWSVLVNDADTPIIVTTITPEPCDCVEMYEGESKNFSIDAYDPDGNELTYLWKFDDNFVSMNSSWDYVSDYNSSGDHQLKLTVSDNNGKNTLSYVWEINVINVDREIVVNQIVPSEGGDLNIFESDSISFSIDAYDPDGNDLSYSWKLNNSEVSITDSYKFYTDYNSSGTYFVSLDVIDGFGKSELSYNWSVVVNDQSTNVSVLSITPSTGGNLTTEENSPINFNISAVDPTGEGLNYSYILDNIEVSTDSSYQFNTDYEGAGEYELKLKVWNSFTKDEVNYQWSITVFDVDRPVVVNSILPSGSGSISLVEEESLTFSVDAYDPDGNPLTYIWLFDENIVSTSNSFNYVTNYNSSGNHNLKLTIDDGYGSKSIVEYEWEISVANVNRPIVVNSVLPTDGGNLSINQNESINFSIDAYDPDGNDLSYSWLLNNVMVSSSSSYLFTTDQSSIDSYSVELIVSDGDGSLINKSWNINMIENSIVVNEVLPSSGGSYTIWESESIDFSVDAFNPNGDPLEYEWILEGEVVSNDSSYQFTTTTNSSGNYSLGLKISSEGSTIFYSWDIMVKDLDQHIVVNQVIPSPGGIYIMEQYSSEEFSIDAYDPDGNSLYYIWKLNGEDVSISNSYSLTAFEAGNYILELRVTDGITKNEIQYIWNIEIVAQD
ncbi:MAG: hypothetical protein CR982_08795 [Candidatus Cloacimonadota bacterium]|nr:MAG: hypothetical protein CR982_08795 [Candidatus Cloacimonadota bacterium]PIE77731.1 MAG: hypothetical protein CSA15_11450 [Candidatus Delongbacteria bacterium]